MNGRVAAVLGVGPGLGTAIAHRFAREGFAVALMARSEESVTGARREIEESGGTALPVPTDATDPASVESAFETVRRELGDPGVLVYNAGAFQMGGILEIEPEKFDECFRANCAGPTCSLKLVEVGPFCELRPNGVFRSWHRGSAGGIMLVVEGDIPPSL